MSKNFSLDSSGYIYCGVKQFVVLTDCEMSVSKHVIINVFVFKTNVIKSKCLSLYCCQSS